MERKVTFEIGEYYHIYNRGVDKCDIFRDPADWDRFLHNLFLYNSTLSPKVRELSVPEFTSEREEMLVEILAYALMPNHFHLIIREIRQGGISKFMSKLGTSHSTYFNTKYKRSGPLMCHPFSAKHIDTDEYFRWVFSYVQLNPIDIFQAGWKEVGLRASVPAKTFLRSYKYCSYVDYYVGDRAESSILSKESLPFSLEDLKNLDSMLLLFRSGYEFNGSKLP